MKDLFAWLLSYFSSSPDTIKPFIFYLSVFPLNHTIRRRRLVRRWIAEGYSNSRDNEECTAEEDGEKSFLKLISLSMVQVPELIMTPPMCQVNGFFLEYINSRPMEDNLVFALKGHSRKNLQRTGRRHLAIHESWDRDQNVFGSIDFSRLRSLTVFGEWKSFFISDKMRLLRILDLEDVSSGVRNDDVKKIVKVLYRLKFLSLRKCKGITHLPESLGNLKQLQTLDIRETFVVELPKSIIKIEKLQYIRAGRGTTPPTHDDDFSMVSPASTAERTSSSADENNMGVRPPLPSTPPSIVASPPTAEPEVVALAAGPESGMSEAAAAPPPTEAAAAAAPRPVAPEPTVAESVSPAAPPAAEPPVPQEAPAAKSTSSLARCCCATLVPNLLSRLRTTHRRVDTRCHHSGVKVPRGIGKLTNLQTLGVVNISAVGWKAFVEELRNLTQLHKLGVSGINKDNCQTFFSAILCLAHLRSLSLQVQVDEDNEAGFLDHISWHPENLRSLKLYGLGSKLPQWIKKLQNGSKLSLQMTSLSQEEINLLPWRLHSLRIFLLEFQVLQFGQPNSYGQFSVDFLEISCSSKLETTIMFQRCYACVLRIRCGRVRSLRVSGLQNVKQLKQVWLSGPYDDALKQNLESEIANYHEEGLPKPVLRLEEPGSSLPYLWTSS